MLAGLGTATAFILVEHASHASPHQGEGGMWVTAAAAGAAAAGPCIASLVTCAHAASRLCFRTVRRSGAAIPPKLRRPISISLGLGQ